MENKKFITTIIISILGLMGLGAFLSLQAPTVFEQLEIAGKSKDYSTYKILLKKIYNNSKDKDLCFKGLEEVNDKNLDFTQEHKILKIACEQK